MRRSQARGFTLVEAMAVVVIVGILALIATYSVRKYIHSAKSSEPLGIIASTKAAQEAYKDETFGYATVSNDLSADAYPVNSKPGRNLVQWGDPGGAGSRWTALGVTAPAPVRFVYYCKSGRSTDTPASPTDITVTNWPSSASQPWYVVEAKADYEGDGTWTVFVGSSFTGDVFSAND